jgi:ribosomal protein L9
VIKKAPAKLTPKKVSAKKGAKKYFQVKVKNKKTKKVIQGVKVKIKVYTGKKAKTFTAKTNAKGIAKISTAKLKVGKHKVVVTSANKYVVAKKAKSAIKIKK